MRLQATTLWRKKLCKRISRLVTRVTHLRHCWKRKQKHQYKQRHFWASCPAYIPDVFSFLGSRVIPSEDSGKNSSILVPFGSEPGLAALGFSDEKTNYSNGNITTTPKCHRKTQSQVFQLTFPGKFSATKKGWCRAAQWVPVIYSSNSRSSEIPVTVVNTGKKGSLSL